MDMHSLLLALPDECLVAVLQHCADADDYLSLFSAAKAHSRLHQAAATALDSITLVLNQQQQADSVLLYLGKHGSHVDSLDLEGPEDSSIAIRELPHNLRLDSLCLHGLQLQLQPVSGFQGVLGADLVEALRQLQLSCCELLDGSGGLAAALAQLPSGLEALCVASVASDGDMADLPTSALQQLEKLTFLEVGKVTLWGPDFVNPLLQPLQALTRLVDLQLEGLDAREGTLRLNADMLSSTYKLTRLKLARLEYEDDMVAPTQLEMEPGVLAGKTLLQHLVLEDCSVSGGAVGVAQLLSHLQTMQQLTHLNLSCSLTYVDVGSDSGGESEPEAVTRDEDVTPPASAYSALTASTKLQLLDIRSCALPTGVWPHMFPVGRQLPYLTSLDISGVTQEPTGTYAPAPEGRLLVRCCTGLQDLEMQRLQYSAEQLPALQELNMLLRLSLHVDDAAAFTNLCQLTGLRGLNVAASDETDELLFQLTQLQQLTGLFFNKQLDDRIELICEGPADKPIRSQILSRLLHSSNPVVAQQAAASLVN